MIASAGQLLAMWGRAGRVAAFHVMDAADVVDVELPKRLTLMVEVHHGRVVLTGIDTHEVPT